MNRQFHTPIAWQDITKATGEELLDEYVQCIIATERGAMSDAGKKIFKEMHAEILRRVRTGVPYQPGGK